MEASGFRVEQSKPTYPRQSRKRVSMVPQLHSKTGVALDSLDCPSLFKCEAFKKLTPENRFETAKHNHLCYNCLKCGHVIR